METVVTYDEFVFEEPPSAVAAVYRLAMEGATGEPESHVNRMVKLYFPSAVAWDCEGLAVTSRYVSTRRVWGITAIDLRVTLA